LCELSSPKENNRTDQKVKKKWYPLVTKLIITSHKHNFKCDGNKLENNLLTLYPFQKSRQIFISILFHKYGTFSVKFQLHDLFIP